MGSRTNHLTGPPGVLRTFLGEAAAGRGEARTPRAVHTGIFHTLLGPGGRAPGNRLFGIKEYSRAQGSGAERAAWYTRSGQNSPWLRKYILHTAPGRSWCNAPKPSARVPRLRLCGIDSPGLRGRGGGGEEEEGGEVEGGRKGGRLRNKTEQTAR